MPDEDEAYFGKAVKAVNIAASRPTDTVLPKEFESDDDDWYVRTGQPAPERVVEVFQNETTAPETEAQTDDPANSLDERALAWLPALAMVSFVLFAIAVLLLIGAVL